MPASLVFNLPKTALKRVVVTSGEAIDDYAFYNCATLESITLPSTVVKIGTYAFGGCSSLKEIVLPTSLTNLGLNAFERCTSLEKVTLPEGLPAIPTQAFMGCSALNELTIPSTVTAVGLQAFYGCNALIENVGSVSYVDTWAVDCGTRVEEVTLREGTVGISDEAFKDCSRMTAITLADTVKYIGHYSFYDCRNLQTVNSSQVLEQIGFHAFYQCIQLRTFSIPDSIQTVSPDSFFGCTIFLRRTQFHLTCVDRWVVSCVNTAEYAVVPANTAGISSGAFGGCSALTTVYFEGTQAEWEAIRVEAGGNDILSTVTVAFLSETEPTTEGIFWHYDNVVPALWSAE